MASLWDALTKTREERMAGYAKKPAKKKGMKIQVGGKPTKRSLGTSPSGQKRANRIDALVSRASRGR